jgi:TIR domain
MDRPVSPQQRTSGGNAVGLKIFVCYRHEDTAGFARALKTVLSERYGRDRIFMDLDNIAPGELWEDVVNKAVSGCDALVALIGRQWLTARNAGGPRRLDDPLDPVRLEIETALREGLKVIPILLQGAKMPTGDKLPPDLARLPGIQALAITDDWDAGVAKLLGALERVSEPKSSADDVRVQLEDESGSEPVVVVTAPPVPVPPASVPPSPSPQRRRWRLLVAALTGLAVVGAGVGVALSQRGQPTDDPSGGAGGGGGGGNAAEAAIHDYLWSAYNLVQESAEQRTGVGAAIQAMDADALRGFQESRRQLLTTVEQWEVPDAARDANIALEQALQFSAISDGNWASYADGTMTSGEARAYDQGTVHPAKFEFDRLFNALRAGIGDAPPRLPPQFLF